MAASAPPAEHPPLSVSPPALSPGEEAAAEVLAPLNYGEQPQIGVLGDTGTGKTVAMVALVDLWLQMSPGLVFVVDDKGVKARYAGQERRDVDDLVRRPFDPSGRRVIVFRGDPTAGVDADPEEVAELAWRRVARQRKTMVVHDELVAGREETIAKSRMWRKGITYIPRSFTKGREPGVGDIWGAQSPQEVPLQPFEQSNGILCFRLAGLGLATLKERDYLQGGVEEVIPRLHGPPQPPPERGDFVLLLRGRPWNGKIYRFKQGGG